MLTQCWTTTVESKPIWLMSFLRVCQQNYPLSALITDGCFLFWQEQIRENVQMVHWSTHLTDNESFAMADINKHQLAPDSEFNCDELLHPLGLLHFLHREY